MKLVESIKARSKADWGKIIDGVPIFVVHKWWERETKYGREATTTLPGDPDPDPKDGWKFVYEVTESDLKLITGEINKNFDERATPMSLLLGHTMPGKPQDEQPVQVGVGANARLGSFGPKKITAIEADLFYRRGHENAAAEYPQRSPEFKQSGKVITGIAMLKTTPRLPMGYHAYEDSYFYGEGFMADEPKPSEPVTTPETESKPGEQTKPNTSTEMATEMAPLEPHEQHFFERGFKHYGCSGDAMKHLGEQHKKYMASQAAMAPASPTSGTTPATPVGGETGTPANKPEGSEEYMDTELQRQYEERIQMVLADNAKLYADREFDKMVSQGIKRSTLSKFKERLTKIYMDAKDSASRDAATKDYLDEVRNNYARESRPPVGRDFLPIAHNEPDDLPTESSKVEHNPETDAAITRYAEEHKINILDDDGWDKAVEGYLAAKNKKQDRKTA